jgi:hypothetical protein
MCVILLLLRLQRKEALHVCDMAWVAFRGVSVLVTPASGRIPPGGGTLVCWGWQGWGRGGSTGK